jgi:hypothetical protein
MTKTLCLAAVFVACLTYAAVPASAQDSKSTALAKELAQLLDQGKIDAIAARDPGAPDRFVAALFLPGQLLVVAARYSVPVLMNERLGSKDYKDVYIDLQSASIPDSRIFVDDLGADGLKARPQENQPYDSFEMSGTRRAFDGQWRKQKLSEDEYMKAFGTADDSYSTLLTLLLGELKKSKPTM